MQFGGNKIRSVAGIGLTIVGLHGAGLVCLGLAVGDFPQLLGMAFLAYTFGLRHALDLDHIAVIDNAVRQIGAAGRPTEGVGLWFSLGHSSVVLVLSVLIALASGWVVGQLPVWQTFGAVWGPAVSGGFLLLIGLVNLGLWLQVWRHYRQVKGGQTPSSDHNHGLLGRLFQPLLRLIQGHGQLYLIGFLFGLGFDTASEVALLALSGQTGGGAVGWWGIVALPLLFAAGMALLDALDGLFMARAYRWAWQNPLKRVYYNLTVTGLSVLTALVIGGVEILQLVLPAVGWTGGFWSVVQAVDLADLGWAMVVIFAVIWAGAWLNWRLKYPTVMEKRSL